MIPTIVRTIHYSTQALISWIVTTIAYTAESYYIEYGQSNDSLTMMSDVVNGSTNLTSINLILSANITGLHPFTRYYYRLVASNSFATSQTAVQIFQTSEAGKWF